MAVFTDPGSPLKTYKGYASLPSHEAGSTSITAKSSGEDRFCKKCQSKKPDRAHHCSTCRRCVLKMDHHCPWLATCVGLRNYKPFVLFLGYTCFFCYLCFMVSAAWVWGQVVAGSEFDDEERIMPVNYVLLCVLAGIIGLVLTGFTGWHIYLATQGQTTIESLEKTRYLTPLRRSMQDQIAREQERHYVGQDEPQSPNVTDRIREFHANALPGVTRPEEGEENQQRPQSAQQSLRRNYADMEAQREHDRYAAYVDERESEKLPNAFDHGWRRNMRHVFGESPMLWLLPICNTTGDGWNWQASGKWLEAREQLARERQAREREDQAFQEADRGWLQHARNVNVRGDVRPIGSADEGLSRSVANSDVSMHTLPPKTNSRPPTGHMRPPRNESPTVEDNKRRLLAPDDQRQTGQWNDLPEDMLSSRTPSRGSMRTRSPRPTRAYVDPNG